MGRRLGEGGTVADGGEHVLQRLAERAIPQNAVLEVLRSGEQIEKYTEDNDVVIVPGKLLSGGELTKKVTIIAYCYSQKTADKINGKAQIISIEEGLKKYPTAKDIKIIG